MSDYSLLFTLDAENDFRKLNLVVRKRIYKKSKWLLGHLDLLRALPLTGPWQGFFKLRIGEWRIIYNMDYKNSLIVVHVIGKRDKIYKYKK